MLYTIGHSNRSVEEFITLLKHYQISMLVDVRTIPKSRHVPWSNSQTLSKYLAKEKINYTWMQELGGLRHAKTDSINLGWQNASFRGYADYMQTPEFAAAISKLNALLAETDHVVIMCAEALPWRCHRSLIADAEVVRHIPVMHIMSLNSVQEHKLTSFAVIDQTESPTKIFYPKPE